LLSSSKHSGVPEDSQPPTFPSVGLHPHTWPKWGCDTAADLEDILYYIKDIQATFFFFRSKFVPWRFGR